MGQRTKEDHRTRKPPAYSLAAPAAIDAVTTRERSPCPLPSTRASPNRTHTADARSRSPAAHAAAPTTTTTHAASATPRSPHAHAHTTQPRPSDSNPNRRRNHWHIGRFCVSPHVDADARRNRPEWICARSAQIWRRQPSIVWLCGRSHGSTTLDHVHRDSPRIHRSSRFTALSGESVFRGLFNGFAFQGQ
jgi:hypothetical protein